MNTWRNGADDNTSDVYGAELSVLLKSGTQHARCITAAWYNSGKEIAWAFSDVFSDTDPNKLMSRAARKRIRVLFPNTLLLSTDIR